MGKLLVYCKQEMHLEALCDVRTELQAQQVLLFTVIITEKKPPQHENG